MDLDEEHQNYFYNEYWHKIEANVNDDIADFTHRYTSIK